MMSLQERNDQILQIDHAAIRHLARHSRQENIRRNWYKISRNPLSMAGMGIVVMIALLAIFAPWVAPYPAHAGAYADFASAGQPPSTSHWFGTDMVGRDILSRIIFALRPALIMGMIVLAIVVPFGVFLGLYAGYSQGTWINMLIMRTTDIFISVPSLVLAMAIASVLKPSLTNTMIAVTVMWWPWYTRLIYGLSSSISNEDFIRSAELEGASKLFIIFREILPNCWGPIFTKMSLDMGFVILIGAALSFIGLGEQAPKPGLGNMVSEGASKLPDQWWIAIFPALAIMLVVLGFNLLGDGLQDMMTAERGG
ncbi:MAG: ABC transporter permease [Anaerolineaceae bacterium]|nr:ABC transporter permease [Anaerolineaceae bacterium]